MTNKQEIGLIHKAYEEVMGGKINEPALSVHYGWLLHLIQLARNVPVIGSDYVAQVEHRAEKAEAELAALKAIMEAQNVS